MIRSLRLALVIGLAAIAGSAALGSEARAETAREVAARTVDEVFQVLRETAGDTKAARDKRLRELRAVVDRVFDWEEMARRSLGAHWRTATPGQRKRYLAVFKNLLADQYIEDMDKFRGTETVEIHGQQTSGDTTIVRSTLITHSRERVPINYYMSRKADRWWVHDISIEGVSLVNHYRKSFSRFLVNHDMEALLDRLESRR